MSTSLTVRLFTFAIVPLVAYACSQRDGIYASQLAINDGDGPEHPMPRPIDQNDCGNGTGPIVDHTDEEDFECQGWQVGDDCVVPCLEHYHYNGDGCRHAAPVVDAVHLDSLVRNGGSVAQLRTIHTDGGEAQPADQPHIENDGIEDSCDCPDGEIVEHHQPLCIEKEEGDYKLDEDVVAVLAQPLCVTNAVALVADDGGAPASGNQIPFNCDQPACQTHGGATGDHTELPVDFAWGFCFSCPTVTWDDLEDLKPSEVAPIGPGPFAPWEGGRTETSAN